MIDLHTECLFAKRAKSRRRAAWAREGTSNDPCELSLSPMLNALKLNRQSLSHLHGVSAHATRQTPQEGGAERSSPRVTTTPQGHGTLEAHPKQRGEKLEVDGVAIVNERA